MGNFRAAMIWCGIFDIHSPQVTAVASTSHTKSGLLDWWTVGLGRFFVSG